VDPRKVERRVLEIVTALAAELGVLPPHGEAALDESLERDLGLGSLERVELVHRLEQGFGVRLPDAVMAEADTPRALARAVVEAHPALPEALPAVVAPPEAGTAAPDSAGTLVEVLRWHAETQPDRVHLRLRGEDGTEAPITYGALWQRSLAVAAALRARGLGPGARAAVMLRTEHAFFSAFFGILLTGAVPVPLYPPFRLDRLEEYARRQVRILDNAGASLLLTFAEAERVAALLRTRVPSLREVVAVERLRRPGVATPPAVLDPLGPALIQYTSGSTGEPKGVVLTHANVLANIRALGRALEVGPADVMVSWLPLYHDMGLIGAWLGPLYFAVPAVIMSPLAFLARPVRWLAALHAHRATISAAPNFAFDLCVRKVGDDEIRGLDLGAWRLALNGSEPVSPDTIERFTRRFAPFGFRPEAMCPVYGLAESSVGLTCPPPGRGPRVDRVGRALFERSRRAEPAPPSDPAPLRFVSCGRPLPGHEVRVVDARGAPVGERVEGRVLFRGPSVTRGYFRNPDATRRAFQDGWMDSGDLGYWADGELFVTGRQKDVIIKAGRNLYPQEIEEVAGEVPGIRKGCVAAFGVADPEIGTERLVVVAESRQRGAAARGRLRAAVVDRVTAVLGLPPDVVVIADPGAVLKTPSGKVRRSATREAYLHRTLARRRPARLQVAGLVLGDLALRFRRLAGDVSRLGWTAWVGAVLALALPLIWALTLALPGGRPLDLAVRRWCRGLLALAGCPLRVEGLSRLPSGGVVLAANHSSYLDVVALLAAIPADFRFVAKRELLGTAVVGRVIRRVGHLTVERTDLTQSVADAERVAAALRRGISLFFFPEGTFVRAPGLLPFRLGAFKAAVEAGCPVVPVAIRGTREILPSGAWLPRRGPITVTIAPPVAPAGDGWREIVRLRDQVRSAIAAVLGEETAGEASSATA
jgi:1-acyl-sn-glycerol-3-phosphate acyltransferase